MAGGGRGDRQMIWLIRHSGFSAHDDIMRGKGEGWGEVLERGAIQL